MTTLLIRILLSAVALTLASAQDKPNQLTETQKKAMLALDADMNAKAGPAALKIAALAKDFDRNALADKPDPELDRKLTDEFSQTVAEVVKFKLIQVRETVKLLTPEQKSLLTAELEKPGANVDLSELVRKILGDYKK